MERVTEPGYLDVPPDVTTGRVVVVVGVVVVVVVVVVVGWPSVWWTARRSASRPAWSWSWFVGAVGAVGAGAGSGPFGLADDPGCSFATMTPMEAVAPPARTIVVVVKRRTRARARSRAIGE